MQPTFSIGMMASLVEVGNVCNHSDCIGMGSLVMSTTGFFPSQCWAFASVSMSSDVLIC